MEEDDEVKKKFRSFSEARKFVRKLGLKNRDEWRVFCKSGEKPDDIPNYPAGVYKNKGWKNLGDWLGTGMIAYQNREYKSFEDTRKFVHSLKLSGRKEWREYLKSGEKPDDIPSKPDGTYKKEWKGLGNFLGTGNVSGRDRHKQFRSLTESRKIAISLVLKTQHEWKNYVKKNKLPNDVPRDPQTVYAKEGWKGWGDFLGTGRVANQNRQFRSFTEAKKFAQSLKLKGVEEWKAYCKSEEIPDNIPSNPNKEYKKEWITWGDWLGTGTVANTVRSANFSPWPEAKQKMRKLGKEYGLKGFSDWKKFAKTHGKLLTELNLPAAPWLVYTKEKVWKRIR